MNPLKQLALFTRDLLGYNEQLIRIGRQNFEREQLETAYIVIDALTESVRVSSLEEFDGDAEEQSLGAIFRTPCTVSFFGTGAMDRAVNFSLQLGSQTAAELQNTYSIAVYKASGMTDVKALTGQQYGEQIEVSLNVEHCQSATVDTLRIDTAQITFRNEKGEVQA